MPAHDAVKPRTVALGPVADVADVANALAAGARSVCIARLSRGDLPSRRDRQ